MPHDLRNSFYGFISFLDLANATAHRHQPAPSASRKWLSLSPLAHGGSADCARVTVPPVGPSGPCYVFSVLVVREPAFTFEIHD